MNTLEAHQRLRDLERVGRSTVEIAKTARRGNKSLSGDNPYGHKFHAATVEFSVVEGKIRKLFPGIDLPEEDAARFGQFVEILKNPKLPSTERARTVKALESLCRTAIEPRLEALTASPIPESEQVLLASVVEKTRDYIERIVAQANGAYHHHWYDACAVMMRRLIETLIIEAYEAKGRAAEIKNGNDFHMLDTLIKKATNDSDLNLSRNTKEVLPKVKLVFDSSNPQLLPI